MERTYYRGEIKLSHRERIEAIRQREGHALASHAFCSLWLWRKQMGLELYLEEELFAVKAAKYGKNTWFFPCGGLEQKKSFLERCQKDSDFALCYLRMEDVRFLEKYFPGRYEVCPVPDASEYLYERTKMEEMAGSRTASMRKQIRKLEKRYEVRIEKISSINQADAMWLLKECPFCGHVPGYHLLRDDGLAGDALLYREELGLFGILVYLDGQPKSFALGFHLTCDTVDGCIEKHTGEIPGISYLTQRAFFLAAPRQYGILNGEEDMGIPGLRMMKQHMAPVGKNEIWEAVPKGERRKARE